MIRTIALISWALLASSAAAQDAEDATIVDRWTADKTVVFEANSLDLADLEWVARPIVVFADSPNDPRFRQQLDLLSARPDDLVERDVIIITDTDPDARGDLRLQLRPRGFMLVIMGKDGEVELRKPAPWDIREISRTIDNMPLRMQEIEDGRLRQP